VGLAFKDKPIIPINEHDYHLISEGMVKAKIANSPKAEKKTEKSSKAARKKVISACGTIFLVCLLLGGITFILVSNIKFIGDFIGFLTAATGAVILIAGFLYIIYLLLVLLHKILG